MPLCAKNYRRIGCFLQGLSRQAQEALIPFQILPGDSPSGPVECIEDRDDLQASEEHPNDADRKEDLICIRGIIHLIRKRAEREIDHRIPCAGNRGSCFIDGAVERDIGQEKEVHMHQML